LNVSGNSNLTKDNLTLPSTWDNEQKDAFYESNNLNPPPAPDKKPFMKIRMKFLNSDRN
jgi:hypothetical protein